MNSNSSSLLLQRQQNQKQKQQQDQSLECEFVVFNKNTLALERKKKYKDRKAGIFVDVRKVYPAFKVDRDLFFLCDYPNPENEDKPCNLFFGAEKSVYAHYSRVHNKQNNPNRIRIREKIQHVLDNIKRLVNATKCKRHRSHKKTYKTLPTLKQTTLLDF